MKKIILIFLLLYQLFCRLSQKILSISDIKVQGLKRVDPGLVFDNIPFEVDTPLMKLTSVEAIQLLYKTGQFKNISIDLEGSVVIIMLMKNLLFQQLLFMEPMLFSLTKLKKVCFK